MLLKFRNVKALLQPARWWTIARSRIFDPNWYRAEYPDCDAQGWNPISHYLLEGAARGNRPHLLFDPDWYQRVRGALQRDPNPLIDYIKYGADEGFEPSPYFSAPFYRKFAGHFGRLTPLGHFLAHSPASGVAPTPLFDRSWYLDNNPDVRRAGFDPFLHFVASGACGGRSPGPLFDAGWYRMKNADVRDQGFEPLPHYLAIGAAEGRNPHPFFDAAFYVASAHRAGVTQENALADYAERGRDEWRSTHAILPPPASPAAYFEDFPWRRPDDLPAKPAASFRLLIVDIAAAQKADYCPAAQLLAALQTLPDLDIYVLTDSESAWMLEGVACLDFAHPNMVLRHAGVVLDRLFRSLKFRDPNALVIEIPPTTGRIVELCAAIGLPYHDATSKSEIDVADWGEILQRRIGYRAAPRPTVSVIVPNYNHAHYLDERLGSIFAQRLTPDEIIFLDDGSSDDSLTVAKAWQAKSSVSFAIVPNEANSGSPFKQWAKGLLQAKCDLVWIAESDDSCHPEFLERMVASFTDREIAIAYSDSQVTGTEGEILSPTYRFYTDTLDETKWLSGYVEDGAREIAKALAIKNTIPNVSAVLFKRSALQAVIESVQNFRHCGDWWTYVECLRQGKIRFCPQALNKHRQEPRGVTQDGERATHAVREALSIKRSIFETFQCEMRVVWLSLAQTIFEYEIRSRALMNGRLGFTQNQELIGSIDELTQRLAMQRCEFPDDALETAVFLRVLAAVSVDLSQTERANIVDLVLEELKEVAKAIQSRFALLS